MKIKGAIILMLGCATWFSCSTTPASKCGPCPLIAELAPFIDVKIVDKVTGADLFLSPSSHYKFSDLKLTSTIDGGNVYVSVDSTQTNNRFIRIIASDSQTFKLTLGNLAEDDIAVVAKRDSPMCCPMLKIKKITLNNTLICSPCNFNQLVTIKK
jgi:hypothetical protein